jgi:hypothetical protein
VRGEIIFFANTLSVGIIFENSVDEGIGYLEN